jgi:Holliday junction DNA helicase RuvA
VENSGIGYQIFTALPHIYKIEDAATFYTYYHHTQEEAILYGFKSQEELILYKKLISVSGVGARTGLCFFVFDDPNALINAINSGNHSYLTKFPRIGRKTADQIILTLKNTLTPTEGINSFANDAIEVLIGLGYSKNDAIRAVNKVKEHRGLDDLIRSALKNLIV